MNIESPALQRLDQKIQQEREQLLALPTERRYTDGTYSEAWRHRCEVFGLARTIAQGGNAEARLDEIAKSRRGPAAAEKLRHDLVALTAELGPLEPDTDPNEPIANDQPPLW